jgi:hypothetical protein
MIQTTINKSRKITLIRVGDTDRPATQADIDQVMLDIKGLKNINHIISHHAFNIDQFDVSPDQVIWWTLGDKWNPATEQDIELFKKQVKEMGYDGVLVSHHRIHYRILSKIKKGK